MKLNLGWCWVAEPWIHSDRVGTRHPVSCGRYILFAFTLGCDCLRTSGVYVTLNQAIDGGDAERLNGSVDCCRGGLSLKKHPNVNIHICVSDCWSKQGSWSCSIHNKNETSNSWGSKNNLFEIHCHHGSSNTCEYLNSNKKNNNKKKALMWENNLFAVGMKDYCDASFKYRQ